MSEKLDEDTEMKMIRIKNIMLAVRDFLFITVLCVFQFGCTPQLNYRAYPGAELPDSEIAKVHIHSWTRVGKVDDKNVPRFSGVLELSPGSHALTLRWAHEMKHSSGGSTSTSTLSSRSWFTVKLDVSAGRTYTLVSSPYISLTTPVDFEWFTAIVDNETKEAIAGFNLREGWQEKFWPLVGWGER